MKTVCMVSGTSWVQLIEIFDRDMMRKAAAIIAALVTTAQVN